ncbi:MAG: ABC transporter ATP-binding protein, partial [Halothiobacillaceae bacterium]|nr:ABC transporter ATP-binding protein [Halothiobacillaceae bacterium]
MTAAIAIRGLTKTYRNGVQALRGIDLTVDTGDFFALLGPNGAGKSTTIGILSSLVDKSDGQVRVFGHDLDRERGAVKAAIGVVPQEFNFNGFEPVEEIVINQAGFYGLPRDEGRRRAGELLEALGLADKRRAMARELSGGMKRRLMIARALVHRPRLLILDEPTAGVDIELRRGMWQFLREVNQAGTTIVLTTHYLEEAESLCRHIAIIDEGRLVERSSMRALLDRLHQETFVLDLAQPLDVAPVLPVLGVRLSDPLTLEVDIARDRPLNALFAA